MTAANRPPYDATSAGRDRVRPSEALFAGLAGGIVAGELVAHLTLGFNPYLRDLPGDALLVTTELGALYGLFGLALGVVSAAAVAIVNRLGQAFERRASPAAGAIAAAGGVAPVLAALLLPDWGHVGDLFGRWLFEGSAGASILAAAALGLVVLVVGWALRRVLEAVPSTIRSSPHRASVIFWTAAIVVVGVVVVAMPRSSEAPSIQSSGAPADVPQPSVTPDPVVVLCIDCLDPDEVLLPMVHSGQLPTIAGLMREGVFGKLASEKPAYSPAVWTTLATGKPRGDHGVGWFVHFRLPGVRQKIDRFPAHSGLCYTLFPKLESLPGGGFRRAPYTSNMVQTMRLWDIVGEHLPVGVYRWLVTWPARPVNGFLVSGGVHAELGVWHPSVHRWMSENVGSNRQVFDWYPPDLFEKPPAVLDPHLDDVLATYVQPGVAVDRSDKRMGAIIRSLRDPTIRILPRLMDRFRPVLTMAGFYSVDSFHHLCGKDFVNRGPYAPAIPSAYRHADARLGQLVDLLDPRTNIIVVSDHGYDFARGHHQHAPDGTFLARGPAFPKGLEVEGLSVYDLAPLVLHLLGLPVPDDMPGARTLAFMKVLADPSPPARIPTYERGDVGDHLPLADEDEEQTLRQLRQLGYIR